MMSIEIKVIGRDADQIRDELRQICALIGLEGEPAPASVDILDLDTLVKATGERLKSQGFEMKVAAIGAPGEPAKKRGRRPAITQDQAKAVFSEPEMADDESGELDAAVADAVKSETINRLTKMYYETGGAVIVNGLLRKHGNGVKSFRDLPAEVFTAIRKDLDDAERSRNSDAEEF